MAWNLDLDVEYKVCRFLQGCCVRLFLFGLGRRWRYVGGGGLLIAGFRVLGSEY